MPEQDYPAPVNPAGSRRDQNDPEATRVVHRSDVAGGPENEGRGGQGAARDDRPWETEQTPAPPQGSGTPGWPAPPAAESIASPVYPATAGTSTSPAGNGPHGSEWSDPRSAEPVGPAAADSGPTGTEPTTYLEASTQTYWSPAEPSAGADAAGAGYGQPDYRYGTEPYGAAGGPYPGSGGYQTGTEPAWPGGAVTPTSGAGPQYIAAPTTNVVLPPVRMPKAESRVALNVLGSVIGLLLVGGGLALTLIYGVRMRPDATSLTSGRLDILAVVLTIVGVVLVAIAALLVTWASWAAILPGLLLSAASVWAMVTFGSRSGGRYIADGTSWAFSDDQLAHLCTSGMGLLIGLLLLGAGVAAVLLRAGVRRTVREQLESIQT